MCACVCVKKMMIINSGTCCKAESSSERGQSRQSAPEGCIAGPCAALLGGGGLTRPAARSILSILPSSHRDLLGHSAPCGRLGRRPRLLAPPATRRLASRGTGAPLWPEPASASSTVRADARLPGWAASAACQCPLPRFPYPTRETPLRS